MIRKASSSANRLVLHFSMFIDGELSCRKVFFPINTWLLDEGMVKLLTAYFALSIFGLCHSVNPPGGASEASAGA